MTDYPDIRGLLLRVWPNLNDELGIWDFVVANDPTFDPRNVRLAFAGDKLVAGTTLLPRRIRTRRGWAPGAELTLVCCHPEHRLQGHGGATVRSALHHLAATGRALAVFYGRPEFYPRFGCAPCFPSLRTDLPAAVADGVATGAVADGAAEVSRADRGREGSGSVALAEATETDVPSLVGLYAERVSLYPGSVDRSAEAWVWKVRNKESHGLWVLPDRRGYARTGYNRETLSLEVPEAAAADGPAAGRLLAGLATLARERGLGKITLILTPDNLVTRTAVLAGAEQHYRPAKAGFAAITDWLPHLPPGYRVCESRGEGLDLLYRDPSTSDQERSALSCDRLSLTQLLMGYRDIDDLLLAADARGAGEGFGATGGSPPLRVKVAPGEALARLLADFPRLYPKYSEAPYYFWS